MKARMDCSLLPTVRVQNVKLESRCPVTLKVPRRSFWPARHLRSSNTGTGARVGWTVNATVSPTAAAIDFLNCFSNANRYRFPVANMLTYVDRAS